MEGPSLSTRFLQRIFIHRIAIAQRTYGRFLGSKSRYAFLSVSRKGIRPHHDQVPKLMKVEIKVFEQNILDYPIGFMLAQSIIRSVKHNNVLHTQNLRQPISSTKREHPLPNTPTFLTRYTSMGS